MKDERLGMLNEANKLTDEIAALQADIGSDLMSCELSFTPELCRFLINCTVNCLKIVALKKHYSVKCK